MPDITPNGEGAGGCSSKDAPATCCQAIDEKVSSCCPQGGSWSRGKALLAALIILAAIGVGAVSLMRGTAGQSGAAAPAYSCSTPCVATSSTNSGGTAAAEAPKPAPCCPAPSPGGAVSGGQ